MRILASRRPWQPRTRIDGLRRFAFVGDSNVFGQGVNVGEAFPARAEALMNEATAAAVEAVNCGVNGYNIWNSWLTFKTMPQVYDGIVFTLCNNDAQLFGRSYEVDYRNTDPVLWAPDHVFRDAIAAAFDDIAEFARNVPIVIGYCNLWPGKAFEDIAETMRTLCEARALPFVNLYTYLVERRITQNEMIVGPADHHPSVLAHDAMARHIVPMLRQAGWLASDGMAIEAAPDAIAEIAAEMVARDFYPVDTALGWSLTALEGKRRLAARLDDGASDAFVKQAERAHARFEGSFTAWKTAARTSAVVEQLMTVDRGVSGPLNHIEEEILRLEELALAADTGNLSAMAAHLPEIAPDTTSLESTIANARASCDTVMRDLAKTEARAAALRQRTAESWLQSRKDSERLSADLDGAVLLADAARERIDGLSQTLARIAACVSAERDLDAESRRVLLALIPGCVSACVDRSERLLGAIANLFVLPPTGTETTIAVQVRTNRIEGRHPCLLEVIVNYRAPMRLAAREGRYFLPDATATWLTMRLPLLYAGRIQLALRLPPAMADKIEAQIEDVRVSNEAGTGRRLMRDEFIADGMGRLVSPPVWLV